MEVENEQIAGLKHLRNGGNCTNDHPPPVRRRKGWFVPASDESNGAINSVRLSEEKHFKEALEKRDKSKELIKLSIGDPAVFGNLPPHPAVYEALKDAVDTEKYNGYGHSAGLPHVRAAVAERFSKVNNCVFTPNDVVMASACSGAIDLSISVLTNSGQNILLPKPGFGIYKCLAGAKQVEIRFYRLIPERNWEVDIDHLESLVDDNTAAIVVNNPSNPCGSVFSKEHVIEIAQFAQRHYLPIISDEIYAEMIFPGHTFHSIASVGVAVPSLICGGIGKQYLIPGWRLGWILIHDPIGAFKDEVRDGLSRLSMKILGPCTVIQAALPAIFDKVPHSFHEKNIEVFRRNAELIYKGLSQVPGLNPIMPAGAMYIMVGIDIGHFPLFKDDIDFTKHLVIEQSVFCLPGTALDSPNFFRIVLVMPPTKISEAIERISLFCSQHYQ